MPGTYRVVVTNPDGCTVAQQFTVNEYCQPRIFIPGAFSPNGDNQNDELEVFHEGVSELELLIYNRWGSVIFSTTDPAKRWDGTSRGTPCDSGVYAYLLRYKSAMEPSSPFIQKTGQVTLLR
ncbi:hypothetical protein BN8_05403 [Fibrisoma limi BUZ 3]|uniref:Gliding motility-associated C-terminal domain-containing protein n=1 Tax=Fibrisoma limi BUZ 3 TaxID=1185876 RepID=I2GQB4_9BACT|nr:gliding motility-associated C-terminal domain-containing protein [Fibrisoma limi]CCH56092.1 hypothetical protein BN8_05403 [Fibrisoma limi BUZ 3]